MKTATEGGPVRRIPRLDQARVDPEVFVAAPEPPEYGYRRLMRAMLEDALMRIARGRGVVSASARLECREALCWFESRAEDWGTFEFVCDSLGASYNPGKIRLYVRRLVSGAATHKAIHRVSGTRTRMGGRIDEDAD